MEQHKAIIRDEMMKIPTYEMGEMERLPIYKKVCTNQGVQGSFYPYKSNDRLTLELNPDHEYRALIMENEYIRVVVLPELGGRIYEGYDKINDHHFIYKNNVIKPELITLNGAWISGGIEFNWPQHHRPTTFLPLECTTVADEPDGSVTAWVGETEPMTGLKCLLGVNVHPETSVLTAKAKIYNPSTQRQPFHWWANLAVHSDESYRLIFPPDIDYVTFHNRTHVSPFPVIKGQFGGYDLGDGLDARIYKNIKAGISVFIFDSQYNFMAGYSDDKEMGTVHVADKYISPGKKFFTWGHCGNATAWETSLSDEDGPYLEIMTACYSDNQPDFTWIMPQETKTFEQRWFSYKGLPELKNATADGAIGVVEKDDGIVVGFNVTKACKATLNVNGTCTTFDAVPGEVYEYYAADIKAIGDAVVIVSNEDDDILVAWKELPMFFDDKEVPEARVAPKEPKDIASNDELYANGIHLEQYKDPTLTPDPYYLEILARDPGDLRANTAMGTLKYRRGEFEAALPYLKAAVKRVTCRNDIPFDSDCYYQLGLVLKQLGETKEAMRILKRCAWQYAFKSAAWFQCAEMEAGMGDYATALADLDLVLEANSASLRARGLKQALLLRVGKADEALALAEDTLAWDILCSSAMFTKVLCGVEGAAEQLVYVLGSKTAAYIDLAETYASAGLYDEALKALALSPIQTALLTCYVEYIKAQMDPNYVIDAAATDAAPLDEIFPNRPFDYKVLGYVMDNSNSGLAPYFLGCMHFHHDVYDETAKCWQLAVARRPDFADARRALSRVMFEGYSDFAMALEQMEKAFELDASPRIMFELYLLRKVLGATPEELVKFYEDNHALAKTRQELVQSYLAMLNLVGRSEDALNYINTEKFYTYEGGEGVTSLLRTYTIIMLGNKALAAGNAEEALARYIEANEYDPRLHEGEKYQTRQSHRLYHVAKGYRAVGDMENYKIFLDKAINQLDNAGEAQYYKGIAMREVGDYLGAAKIFNELKTRGAEMMTKEHIQFFLGFPTPLPFEMSQTRVMEQMGKIAYCLGCIGLGEIDLAKEIIADMRSKGMPTHWLELALSER